MDGERRRIETCWMWLACGLAFLMLANACSRSRYRRLADAEAVDLIREKSDHPHWDLPDYHVYVDPRSRMFDPFDPDGPPMPPDDPTSHKLMRFVDGKRGFPQWHRNGDTPFVENPTWLDYLPMDERGVLKLDSENVVELALIHSPTYQRLQEEIYLSALDVSFERFRFDTQFFAGYQTFLTADGRQRAGSGGNSRSNLTTSLFSKGRRDMALQKSFTTGADLVVGMANSLVWQLSGPDDYNGSTLIDFALVQPLLRNAGRDRILERLTVAERILLANVRQMQRYRGAFYVDLLTGRNPGQGPSRRGGVFGAGLEGFTGVGGGGFGGVGGQGAGAGIGGGGATGAGAQQAGGYIGLLQQQQQIRNQEDNIDRLRVNLLRLEISLQEMLTTLPTDQEAIPRQRLQVAQARQALFQAEGRLLNSRNQFEQQLDAYKAQVGLPPEICVEIKDTMLDKFNLIDEAIKPQQALVDEVIERIGEINGKILATAMEEKDETTNITRRSMVWTDALRLQLMKLREELKPIETLQQELRGTNLPRVEDDLLHLAEVLPGRRADLAKLRSKHAELAKCPCPLLPVPTIDPIVFDVKRLDGVQQSLRTEVNRLTERFQNYPERLAKLNADLDQLLKQGSQLDPFQLFEQIRDLALLGSQDVLIDLRLDILALEIAQVRARTESISLVDIDIPACEAMQIALRYRHDLMNARSQLVDSWRLIEFNADNLESTLDLFFSGDMGNTTSNPFNLKSTTGRLRVGVQFDAPIVRLAERNTYRQSLIEYQQARRTYYAAEDAIARGLRTTIRTLENNRLNFEFQRFSVLVAAEQIDLNEDIRVLREALRQPSGATAARDSVSALTDLLNAQNDFLSIWVNYDVLRRALDLDLGTLQLDERGLWIDPGPVGPDFATVVAERIPLGDEGSVIERWESEGVIPEYRHTQPGSGPQPGMSPVPTPSGAPVYYDDP
ncbi:MAG: hypothetical protein FJ295_03535 [Planctomycetes bacterium]|nr:hypothetical protein [Planctomycetota bacterium]